MPLAAKFPSCRISCDIGPGHGSVHFLCISRLHSDPLQAVSFALECNLRGFFSSGYVLKYLYIHTDAFTCRNPKKVSL